MLQTCSLLNRLASKRGCGRVSIGSIRRLSSSSVSSNESVVAVQDNDNNQTDEQKLSRRDFRFIFPEFLPDPNPAFRNPLAEKLQRQDLLSRRNILEIPEFYVGSYMAVTVSDSCSPHPNKLSRYHLSSVSFGTEFCL